MKYFLILILMVALILGVATAEEKRNEPAAIQISLFDSIKTPGETDRIRGVGFSFLYGKYDSVQGVVNSWGVSSIQNDLAGGQGSFLVSTAGNISGYQASGFGNFSKNTNGGQVALFVNKAEELNGFQFSLINISGRMKGIQYGLINISQNSFFPFIHWWD